MSVSVDDLKAPGLWKFKAHGDGSDKSGRFSINFYDAEFAGHVIHGFKKQWSSGGYAAGYTIGDLKFETLAEVAAWLGQHPINAGDDPEARDD